MSLRVRSSLALLALAACAGGCASTPAANRRVTPSASVDLWTAEVPAPRPDAPVLLIPGGAWLAGDLGPLATSHRLVFYDLRGRGHSPPVQQDAGMTIDRDVADLEALRASLGVERVSILGWAYRGGVALRYALAHPEHVASLVLVAPLPPRREPYWREFRRAVLARSDTGELARLDEMRTSGQKQRNPELYARRVADASLHLFVADPACLTRMRSDPCVLPNLDPDATAALGAEIVRALGDWDWRAELPSVTAPVLIVHGRRDLFPVEGSREAAGLLPHARLIELEGVAHMPWLEQPDAFFDAVRAFLDDPSASIAQGRAS